MSYSPGFAWTVPSSLRSSSLRADGISRLYLARTLRRAFLPFGLNVGFGNALTLKLPPVLWPNLPGPSLRSIPGETLIGGTRGTARAPITEAAIRRDLVATIVTIL
ncbi:hypothetical protein ABW19_dt0205354 [Dactylella cylindrospora]|nr:hypothetical protein ABW19_dt0205354 [Dactylella cylindrospora]